MKQHLFSYVLQLADNALILGHRISEWCGHGPVLEQDIAITNAALDHIGQARNFYQYAADIYNQLDASERQLLLTAPAFVGKENITEDDLAYLRDAWDFKNVLLVEQQNADWAFTVARSFYYDTFAVAQYERLQTCKDVTLAAIAEKALKEASYHRKWSSEWVIRLGDGTEESKEKMQYALDNLWPYTAELFISSPADEVMLAEGIGVDLQAVREDWNVYIRAILEEATLVMPDSNWVQQGGKVGTHSEHLGFILAELQFMQRAYPGMEW